MKKDLLSKTYAESLHRLGEDQKVDIAGEMAKFVEVVNKSRDLETLIFLDVFSPEEKLDVVKTVMQKLKLSRLAQNAIGFFILEGRIGLLPTIYKDLVVLEDHKKGFLRGVVEGPSEIEADFEKKLRRFLKKELGSEVRFRFVENKRITVGHRATVGDFQLDATLDNQLDRLKTHILN